jgi:hypothetical protein
VQVGHPLVDPEATKRWGARFRAPAVLLATALGAIVLAGVLFALKPAVQPTVTDSLRPGDMWPATFVLQPGDRAVGAGQLVAREGEPTRLCTGKDPLESSRGAQFRCSPASVELAGFEVRSLPGAHLYGGAVVVDFAVVHGRWDGRVLAVDAVGGRVLSLPVAPVLACDVEAPGAVPEGSQTLETEAAYVRLQAEVDSDPDGFAGLWVVTEGRRTAVVATTRDLGVVVARLRRVFPFALCVTQVRFSMTELKSLMQDLRRPDGSWWVDISVERNRVLVWIPILDADAVRTVASKPAVELLPLLMREGAN